MQMVEYKQWLKDLKIGDMVAMNIGTEEQVRYAISIVTDISPEGRITTVNEYTFNSDGQEYRLLPWGRKANLLIPTEEIANQIQRVSNLVKIRNTNFDNCSLDQLNRIVEILEEGRVKLEHVTNLVKVKNFNFDNCSDEILYRVVDILEEAYVMFKIRKSNDEKYFSYQLL